jgi:hypothetical protein
VDDGAAATGSIRRSVLLAAWNGQQEAPPLLEHETPGEPRVPEPERRRANPCALPVVLVRFVCVSASPRSLGKIPVVMLQRTS